jgi:hypothetical protein
MALKVCNTCGSRSYLDECPACLGAGRGSVRDYHYEFEETAAPASPEGSVADVGGEEVDTESTSESDYDAEHLDEPAQLTREDLAHHSRVRLQELARERDLDTSGTKTDLIDRLITEVPG